MKKILFVCQANVGRSQMAQGYYNFLTKSSDALSAGLIDVREKYRGRPAPEIVDIMAEDGVNIRTQSMSVLSPQMVEEADEIVVLCAKDELPAYLLDLPHVTFAAIQDPYGLKGEALRRVRDEIKSLVVGLVASNNRHQQFFSPKKVIGAVHFMPSPGFDGYQGTVTTLEKARKDTRSFIEGGVDALIFENNYDYPHTITISESVEQAMTSYIQQIAPTIDFGISVLWNDYKAALRIAQATGGKFIRVPVFVDHVRTQYGDIKPSAHDCLEYRKEIGAENILILTDIHVKHAELLSSDSLLESASKAIEAGSDGLILTGNWTGNPPSIKDLREARTNVGNFPLIIGSGADKANIQELLEFANGVIVSTSVKSGKFDKDNVNRKSYNEYIDIGSVKAFMKEVRQV